MRISSCLRAACSAALVVVCAQPAAAQLYESVGTRAQGMAGAFVAVADDATATWWNPAGVAGGAYFNVILERGQVTEPADPAGRVPASRLKSRGFSAAFPALGLSYYRLRISEIAAISPTAASTPDRQDPGAAGATARTLSASQFGATVDQSVGRYLVLASTLKLVRGGVTSSPAAAGDPLGAAEDVDVDVETRADLDVGAMVNMGNLRAGVSVRNLRQPEFGSGTATLRLKRQARAGLAFLAAPRGTVDAITVAGDVDLMKTATVFGEVRHIATGTEVYLAKRHVAVRGGVMANTIGERRPSTSYGVSVAPVTGIYIDAARISGSDDSVKGWSGSLRVTF